MRRRAGETVGETRSQTGRLVLTQPGYFHGFHYDGLERRESTVVLSTNPLLKLRLVVFLTRGLRGKEKGNVYSYPHQLEMALRRCYAVFYSTMMVVVVHLGEPVVQGSPNLRRITSALFSCQTVLHSVFLSLFILRVWTVSGTDCRCT